MTAMQEVWKPIPIEGVSEWYEASNLGRVRSWKVTRSSKRQRVDRPRVLSPKKDKRGYMSVYLYGDRGKTFRYVHALVALAFLGPCPEGCEVNHKSGVKFDNRVENLEYVTPSENIRHAIDVIQTMPIGERRSQAKLSDSKVRQAVKMWRAGWTQAAIGKMFGVNQKTISLAVNGKLWKHVKHDDDALAAENFAAKELELAGD